jgi:hypothetical protein
MGPDVRKASSETLHYLHQMLGELRTIAEAEGHAMLAYLIEMAYLEVSDIRGRKMPLRAKDK